MKVLIRNIAMLVAVLCSTYTVYAQSGPNAPQSAEAKINVKTIQPLSVEVDVSGVWAGMFVIKGETRNLEDLCDPILFKVSGEANYQVEVSNNENGKEISGKGVSYQTEWLMQHKNQRKEPFDGSKEKNKLSGTGNGLQYKCILKSVSATSSATLGNHTHEFTITVIYADY